MVIGKVAIGRAIFKHQNEQFFLIQLYFHNNLDEGDVENTTIDKDDIVIDTIEFNEPDPAIVDSKNKERFQGSQTGQVRMIVELQLIKLNKMAEEQR